MSRITRSGAPARSRTPARLRSRPPDRLQTRLVKDGQHTPGGRVGGHLAEERLLVAERAQVGQAVAAVGKGEGEIAHDTARVMARAALANANERPEKAPVSPTRSASPATSAVPARDVSPRASATTCTLSIGLAGFTRMVILLGRGIRKAQPESSLLRRTSTHRGKPSRKTLPKDPG
jgi:hypothetical protein